MIDQTYSTTNEKGFKEFIFKDKFNRFALILVGIAIIVQFGIFKYFYPFASYIHGDSFSYLTAAEKNLDISTYLIGYSKFLRLFSVFSRTDYALSAFQYLLLQCSSLFLLLTIFYFYTPRRITQTILLFITAFNPLFLHLGNLISSDGFFLALSILWFALLLWIIHQSSTKIIVFHAIVLFIAFTVRHNAMIYPIISVLAFLLSKTPWQKRIIGLFASIILCGCFAGFTMYKYKQLTGHWQYSPFSGWQWANNAMYAYRYVDSAERKPVKEQFKTLDDRIRQFFDSTRDVNRFPTEAVMASTFYMWSPSMPLVKHKIELFKNDTTSSELKKWASTAPLYKEYGIYIIKQYPWQFIRYFIWPNGNKYYAPPIEFLEYYNSGKKNVTKQAMNWFGYKSRNINSKFTNAKVEILTFYPIISGMINVTMLISIACYIILKGRKHDKNFSFGVAISSFFWIINALFTIAASSAALRFQAFPILLSTIFSALLIDWMVRMMAKLDLKHDIQNEHLSKISKRKEIRDVAL